MKYVTKFAGIGVLFLAVISCSLAGRLAEKGLDKTLNAKRVDSLWSDVPRMDGLNVSPTEEMPLAAKLAMHTLVNLVLNSDKDQKQHVSTDWIFFEYDGKGSDIESFYTPERMKSGGNWQLLQGMQSPCMDGTENGITGEACLYQKQENGKQEGMIILAMPSNDPKMPGLVCFFRAKTEAEAPQK